MIGLPLPPRDYDCTARRVRIVRLPAPEINAAVSRRMSDNAFKQPKKEKKKEGDAKPKRLTDATGCCLIGCGRRLYRRFAAALLLARRQTGGPKSADASICRQSRAANGRALRRRRSASVRIGPGSRPRRPPASRRRHQRSRQQPARADRARTDQQQRHRR